MEGFCREGKESRKAGLEKVLRGKKGKKGAGIRSFVIFTIVLCFFAFLCVSSAYGVLPPKGLPIHPPFPFPRFLARPRHIFLSLGKIAILLNVISSFDLPKIGFKAKILAEGKSPPCCYRWNFDIFDFLYGSAGL